MNDDQPATPESLLPYEAWTQEALRLVAIRALSFVSHNGLPGEHHFYITFRTDHPGTNVPTRLRGQYPREMTIVLQHQFWDLAVDEAERVFSVGLSFGNIPSILTVPFDAIIGFADPHVRFGLRFEPIDSEPEKHDPATETEMKTDGDTTGTGASPAPPGDAEVVSLDAFRRRSPGKD